MIGIGAGGHNRWQSRVVKTKVISRVVAAFIMRSRHVSPAHQAQEGRQGAPLLEHRGESPDRRRPGGAAAAAVPGRDQRFAGTGLAQVNRHPGGRGTAAAHAVAVSGGPLRGIAAGCLDRFWGGRLPPSRKGTRWDRVLLLLATYRLLAPGSEWRLHREWFERSAMADLLGEDLGLAEIHKLYRCHDRLLEHKQALFDHLVGRWRDLFNISFDVLLYDLTSTYFGAPGQAWRFQRVRFPHRQGVKPLHRKSSLGLMEVTT